MDLITSAYDDDSDNEEMPQNPDRCERSKEHDSDGMKLSSPIGLDLHSYGDTDNQTQTCKSVNQSPKCDYFGLTTGDFSDDSYDEIITVSAHKSVKRDISEYCDKRKLSIGINHNSPETKFWRGDDDDKVDWDDPDSVWRSKASNTNTREVCLTDQKNSKSRDCIRENTTSTRQVVNRQFQKSCFVVHHRVAPYLHSNIVTINKPPKNELCEMNGHMGAINRVQWCIPNYSHLLLTACMDNTVRIWNAFSSQETSVQTLCHHDKAVKDAKWSPSGLHILSSSYDKSICLMDVEKGCCISRFIDDSFVTCVTYHPVDHNIFVSGAYNSMKSWDCRTAGKPIKCFYYKDNIGQVQDIVFMGNGSQFFSCNDLVTRDSADRNIMAWDFTNGVVLSNQIYQERYTCCRLRVHPDQSCVMAQSQANYIALFSTVRPYKLNRCKRYEAHKVLSYSVGLDISNDGQFVITGSSDGNVPIYDYRSTRVVRRLNLGQHQVVLDVAWHPLLISTVAVVTWDGDIHVYH